MDRNIRSSSPTPSTTSSVDSGIGLDEPKKGSAFSRTATRVNPQLNQQDLEPAATQAVKITDRVTSDLTKVQKLKLGLLRLGAALLSGTRANHWLADKALDLLQTSYTQNQRSVAVQLQRMIEGQLIHLDSDQQRTYEGICSSFANDDALIEWFDEEDIPPAPAGRLVFDEIEPEEEDIPPAPTDKPVIDEIKPEEDKFQSIAELDKTFSSKPPAPEVKEQELPKSDATFMVKMNALHDGDRSGEALIEMEKEFFDGASHRAIKNPLKKWLKKKTWSLKR